MKALAGRDIPTCVPPPPSQVTNLPVPPPLLPNCRVWPLVRVSAYRQLRQLGQLLR
jgi:hypothetical protein